MNATEILYQKAYYTYVGPLYTVRDVAVSGHLCEAAFWFPLYLLANGIQTMNDSSESKKDGITANEPRKP